MGYFVFAVRKFVTLLCVFGFIYVLKAQECPRLVEPMNNQANVPVDTAITWNKVEGVTGYIVSIGITPGGTEIVDQQSVGGNEFIQPPVGLPDDTRVYVTITLFFFNRPNISCPSESFRTIDITTKPNCTRMNRPLDGDTNVNVASNIQWDYSPTATGYLISIGSSPSGTDIVNNLDVGNVLSYNPPGDFNPDSEVYVTITPYNENGNATDCIEESFSIGPLATLPECTRLTNPIDGQTNVSLSPFIEWEDVPGATGYRVFIGKTPTDFDVLNGGVFTGTSTYVLNFESNNVYFIKIVPFNAAGDAIGCTLETFSTVLGCGPFYDNRTGDLISLNPIIADFPDFVGICSGVVEQLEVLDEADGYRWYKVDQFGENLISEEQSLDLNEEGSYVLELYNLTDNNQIECSTFKEFEVVLSERPSITDVNINEIQTGLDITVLVSGLGEYEYALDSIEGPYQDQNQFFNASSDTEKVYVRDKNGCGIDEFQILFQSTVRGFPKFFTPNGDGFNDRWNYRAKDGDAFVLEVIEIYNRYGRLLKRINPNSSGWDGSLGGFGLPTSDYWYKATTTQGQVFTGHFALKR